MSIRLQFASASFQRKFGQIIAQAEKPLPILIAGGREVANVLKRHFGQKDRKEPNKLSERRTHFWREVARSVSQPEQTGYNAITVTISDPRFAQKVFGGKIRAKNADALTIPVEERAYGRSAATFERETGLKLILIKTGPSGFEKAILAVKENDKSKALTVEYILTPSVTQQADTDALPDKARLENAILVSGQRVLDRQIASNNPSSVTE